MWDLAITNVAGIRSGRATLERGVNVVQAGNWQGKSSLLAAIRTAMGATGLDGEGHPLTEDAAEGRVELDTPSGTFMTELARESGGRVVRTRETYLEDRTDRVRARLFAFLGENNPVRAAVREGDGGDLAGLLRRPLELENIDERIADLRDERRRVERDLEEAERAGRELPAVEEAIADLEGDLASLRERREELAADAGTGSEDGGDLRDRLSDRRAALERVEADVERLRNRIERTEATLETKRAELADLEVPDEPAAGAGVEETRDRIRSLEARIGLLEDVYSANKRVLEEDQLDLVTAVERRIAGDELACWVCGETTTEAALTERLEALQSEIESLRAERDDREAELREVRRRREAIEADRRTRDRLESEVADLERELSAAERDLEDARERREGLADEVEALEARVEQVAADVTARLADVESEIRFAEEELAGRREERARLADRCERVDRLSERRDDLTERIESLRERKRAKQRELKEQFDAAMEEVIAAFDPGFESARLDVATGPDGDIERCDLVVAREGRRARLDALSEGERELVGIVAALAGYRTFDVGERVPVMLLDGVGPLASGHVHRLVDYLGDEADLLVTTAYPAAGDFPGHAVSPEEWDVVSDGPSAAP